ERWKGSICDSRQSDMGSQVFPEARPGIEKLSTQVAVAKLVRYSMAEHMSVSAEKTLYSDIGDIRQRDRFRNAVRAGVVSRGIIDVVPHRERIRRSNLVIDAAHDDIAIQRVPAAADVVIRIRCRAGAVRQGKVLQRCQRDRIDAIGRNDVVLKRLASARPPSRAWLLTADQVAGTIAQIRKVALAVQQSRHRRGCFKACELPSL